MSAKETKDGPAVPKLSFPPVDLDALEERLKAVWRDPSRASSPSTHHEILPGLWLGGCEARPPAATHVLTLVDPDRALPFPDVPDERRLVIRINDSQGEDIAAHFAASARFLAEVEAAGGTAYVHCQQGRSRSATIVISYLVLRGATLLEAWAHVMERRHISALNLGFFAQLALLEQSHRGDVSFSLLDYWRTTVLHLDNAACVSTRAAGDGDIRAEWQKQEAGEAPDGMLGRLVKGLRFVAEDLPEDQTQTLRDKMSIISGAGFARNFLKG